MSLSGRLAIDFVLVLVAVLVAVTAGSVGYYVGSNARPAPTQSPVWTDRGADNHEWKLRRLDLHRHTALYVPLGGRHNETNQERTRRPVRGCEDSGLANLPVAALKRVR